MLSVSRFTRINGHAPVVTEDLAKGMYRAGCECACGVAIVTLWGDWKPSKTRALSSLLDMVLAEHRAIVLERANWHCQDCDAGGGLSVHHIVFRSHGRDDRIVNLKAQCLTCHNASHGIKQVAS